MYNRDVADVIQPGSSLILRTSVPIVHYSLSVVISTECLSLQSTPYTASTRPLELPSSPLSSVPLSPIMLPLTAKFVVYSLLAVTSVASPAPIDPRQGTNPQPSPSPPAPPRPNPCAGNTATTRSQWCGHSINTDYTEVVPDTGVTKEYWLELTDMTLAPDGVCKSTPATCKVGHQCKQTC
jgi:hypothetical protein